MRETNYDILRGLAAFLVIALHVSANDLLVNLAHPNLYFSFACLTSAFTRMSVPLFVMLSGAFVLASPASVNYRQFYKKSWKRIVFPTLLWSAGYVACKYVFVDLSLAQGYKVDVWQPLKDWLAGVPYYHLWYLYMILGMYAAVPLIMRIRNRLSPQSFLWFGLIAFVLGMFIDRFIPVYWPFQFLQYLGYFVLGYVIRNELIHSSLPERYGKWFRGSSKIYMLLTLIAILTAFVLVNWGVRARWMNVLWLFNNQSPTIVVAAVSCFLAFANLKTQSWSLCWKRWITRIAAQSFFIYLIHAGILHMVLYGLMKMKLIPSPFLFIPLASLGLFFGSYVCGEVFDQLRKRIKT